MSNFYLASTDYTPEIHFEFSAHRFYFKGESWPEDAAGFYLPLLKQLEAYGQTFSVPASFELHLNLRYFNSSSTKMLFKLIGLMNEWVEQGHSVKVYWYSDPEDELSLESGLELCLDFPRLAFIPVQVNRDES